MIRLTGYRINEEIFKDDTSTVFRGTREFDNCPVMVKLLNKEYPTGKEFSAFIREYEIIKRLTGDGIIRAYELIRCNNSLAIAMEDIGGVSVDKALQSFCPTLEEKLSLAVLMTQSLIQVHRQNIIHKDVNPSNFIWNYKTNQLKIIDFGISAELVREAPQYSNINNLEGTLDYIAPEQTRRVGRPIDSRTDLYSLGITFYELFTGQLPFRGADESEIVYCHIAKTPVPPNKVNSEIPAILSDIVMKLLSKTAEERYQSAFGLYKDLKYCLQCIGSKSETCGFIPGEGDVFDRFEIPQKLYGRDKEIEMLIDGFEKAADGHCELLLVCGYSGIGKTSLIYGMRKPINIKKGRFISGKFNQSERNNSYFGITRAFQELIRQLLAESQSNLDHWKQRIEDALGNNGQVMVDIIPELEQIIGPQKQVIELNPMEAQNRLHMVFCELIKVFAGKEHPLVVFLDDLQWSDTSTLELLKYILETGVPYILLIGAYRDNEVQAGHPLLKLLEDLKKEHLGAKPPFGQIVLKPLTFDSINWLLADTLYSRPNEAGPLAELILQKTKGNPFFINRLLNSLHCQGAFTFLTEKGQWVYDLQKVESTGISENVVDLLMKSLDSLPADVIEILRLAACIGNQFDFRTVALLSNRDISAIGMDFWTAIEREIIIPMDENYRLIKNLENALPPLNFEIRFCFVHDRIRQAVYSLILEREKPEIHLLIGRKYLESFRETKRMDSLFDLVNHLNAGRGLIRKKTERIELMDLNFMAGQKAKKTTAFVDTLSYFATAESLLSEKEWAEMPEKLFRLYVEYATTALLSGDLVKAGVLCDRLSGIALSNIDKVAVANIKVQMYEFQGKLAEAIDEIRQNLLLFNIVLPQSDLEIKQKIQEGILKVRTFLAQTPFEKLVNLPDMIDPEKNMVMQLLFQLIPPALQNNPPLYYLASLMMFDLTVAYGISPLSCKCFADCGVMLGNMLGDYETGYELGKAAVLLINQFKAESLKPAVYFSFTFCSHWRAHYKESLNYFEMAYLKCLETGNIMKAAYDLAYKVHLFMWTGKNLTECRQETQNVLAYINKSKTATPLTLAKIVYGAVQKLQAIPEKDDWIEYDKKDQEMLAMIEKTHDLPSMVSFCEYNTYVNMITGNMNDAEKWNTKAEKFIFAALSDFPIADHYLFQALILIHKWTQATTKEQAHMQESLINIRQKLKCWAENCPVNFAHKYYLFSAKMAIIENATLEVVVDLFKKAMDSIENDDFIQQRALCNELFGQFWLEREDETAGKAYIREAYYLYVQWGAHRKIALMEKQYPHYFTAGSVPGSTKRLNKATVFGAIDMASIVKSTQAISSEIKTEKLLNILIRTMIENAGAQRGCLLLKNEADNQLYIEAIQSAESGQAEVMQSLPFVEYQDLCPEIVQYVARTGETVVIHDASLDDNWQSNSYILKNCIKSVLCMPVIYQNRLKGVVYLENNLTGNVFTSEKMEIQKILSSQASISIENARLYGNMEKKEQTLQKSEQQALALIEELRKIDKNRNDFINTLSHELRNPLAAITAGLSLLDMAEDGDQARATKEIINRQVGQLCRLVDDLLDLTRVTNNKIILKKERVELNELAREVAEEFMILFKNKNAKLETALCSNNIYINADPVRLKQTIGNLLHNALKFSKEQSKTRITVYHQGGEAIIRVADNGIGIDSDFLPHVFEPLKQANNSFNRTNNSGLGLGLAIVKCITELHGGKVSVASKGGGMGAEFFIRLPYKESVQGNEEQRCESIASSHRILLIEDNCDFISVFRIMLEFLGHEVACAYSGTEGVQRAVDFKPDVIFCDIGLPDLNGYEVAKYIRKNLSKDIFMISLTGFAGPQDVELAREAGFNSHLAKPVDPFQLRQVLADIR